VQQQCQQGVLESLGSLVYSALLAVFAVRRNAKLSVLLGLLSSFLEASPRTLYRLPISIVDPRYRQCLNGPTALCRTTLLILISYVCVLVQMGLRETRPLAAISRVQLPSSIFHPASLYSVLSQTILVTALTYGHIIKASLYGV
jgi:hypothetical protein